MAVPTIASVVPASGPTRGQRIVKIAGTNFQLRPAPPATGKTTGSIKEAVQVLFGTEPAAKVYVLSSSLIHAVTPAHDPGTFGVTVRNVDQDGVLVGAETVTAAGAYTFARPDFNRQGVDESVLARVVRAFLREMKRQLVENVELAVHTDYDDTIDSANVAMLAAVPGIVLAGPFLRENRLYTSNQPPVIEKGSDMYLARRGRVVDLEFNVTGVNDLMQPTLNFQQEVVGFFEGNKNLRVLADPTVPGEYVEFEMKITKDFAALPSGSKENNSNIYAFNGTISIVGVELPDDDMAETPVFAVNEVSPDGSAMPTQGVIFTGQPGTVPAAPIPANPPAQVGNTGSFEAIPPEGLDE